MAISEITAIALQEDRMVTGLAAKLIEKAGEAARAVDDRQALMEKMADVTEVVIALMAFCGISMDEVFGAAEAKAKSRGRFESGVWLLRTDAVRRCDRVVPSPKSSGTSSR